MKNTETPCRFAVGDRVVCIESDMFKRPKKGCWNARRALKPHTCYIVRAHDHSETGIFDTLRGTEPGIYLVGMFGQICPDGSEASYAPDDFVFWEDYQARLREAKKCIPATELKFWRA